MSYSLLGVLACVAFYTDMKFTKIPNKLTVSMTLVAITYHGIVHGGKGLSFALLGCLTGVSVMLVLYICRAVGAGDVKLFGAIGAIMGWPFTLDCLMYSIICAGLIGLGLLLWRQRLMGTIRRMFDYLLWMIIRRKLSIKEYASQHEVITFPYMYAVLPAIMMTFYFG